ncbi:MAG: hypothetical protein JNM39_09055 [Bdellovibrionaceae bacterium]|nr:hypothetical protein [Pseudobdellovibrionaceae bacterium]
MSSQLNVKRSAFFQTQSQTQAPVTEDEVRKILELSVRYPSGDNCQPFRLEHLDSARFAIHYLADQGAHFFNMKNMSSLLSFGALIESMNIAASQFSCEVDYKIEKDFGTDQPCWGTVTIHRTGISKSPWVDSLKTRFTNRDPYESDLSDLEFKTLDKILNNIKLPPDVTIASTKISMKIENYFLLCDEFFWTTKRAVTDLARWIRLKSKPIPKDGFSLNNLRLKFHEALFIILFAKLSILIRFLYPVLTQLTKGNTRRLIRNSAGVIFIALSDDRKISYMNTGRSLMRIWLELTAQGYQVQPLSLGSEMIYALKKNLFDHQVDPHWLKKVSLANKELQSDLGFNETENIVWAFRFGKAIKSAPIPELTGRRGERFNLKDE